MRKSLFIICVLLMTVSAALYLATPNLEEKRDELTLWHCERTYISSCTFLTGCLAEPAHSIWYPSLGGLFFDEFVIDENNATIYTLCNSPDINCNLDITYRTLQRAELSDDNLQELELFQHNRSSYGTRPQYISLSILNNDNANFFQNTLGSKGSIVEMGDCQKYKMNISQKTSLIEGWSSNQVFSFPE